MPKQKSHSGAKKRVRITGSGKFALKRSGRRHLLQQKSARQKSLPSTLVVENTEYKTIKKLLS
jgi:large subunit ribosomal protein L35